jgi:hypothetical protein
VQEPFFTPMRMFAFPLLRCTPTSRTKNTCINLVVAAALLIPGAVRSQRSQQTGHKGSFGVAWRVIGPWRIAGNGNPISPGDAVPPGALLQPLEGPRSHSVTILLPDGQRVLYECFAPRDCDRGFRVPSLYRKPSSTASDLLARINAVLLNKDFHIANEPGDSAGSRDEAAVLIGFGNKVEVAGLAAALSDGTYSYVARSVSHPSAKEARGVFEKHGRTVMLSIPSEGLFKVLISDRLNTPRIDLLLAAARPPRGNKMVKSFQDVEALLKDWNEDYQGWPIHEFRRAYLRSVMLDIEPATDLMFRPSPSRGAAQTADVTCEPMFEPAPGVFKVDTAVTLQCGTPGATIHYTVDGSQPLEGAAAYHAPIVVKGTALMIKAFASAPGKKDSPVVTGIFRIGE